MPLQVFKRVSLKIELGLELNTARRTLQCYNTEVCSAAVVGRITVDVNMLLTLSSALAQELTDKHTLQLVPERRTNSKQLLKEDPPEIYVQVLP